MSVLCVLLMLFFMECNNINRNHQLRNIILEYFHIRILSIKGAFQLPIKIRLHTNIDSLIDFNFFKYTSAMIVKLMKRNLKKQKRH